MVAYQRREVLYEIPHVDLKSNHPLQKVIMENLGNTHNLILLQ